MILQTSVDSESRALPLVTRPRGPHTQQGRALCFLSAFMASCVQWWLFVFSCLSLDLSVKAEALGLLS